MSGTDSPAVRIGGRITAADIPDALTRAPFTYTDGATQVFTPDGRTIYTENDVPTFGKWGVTDQGQFWSFWPPSYRATYDVFWVRENEKIVGVRFLELVHGSTSEGRYTPDVTSTVSDDPPPSPSHLQKRVTDMSDPEYRKDPGKVAQLTTDQFDVTQKAATEPPFRNEFWDNHEAGLYVDIVSGEPLFTSIDKFDSGTGWPCFTVPIDSDNVVLNQDTSFDMVRTEVRSKHGDSHLGHLFNDGPPAAGGTRYCINSAALRFIPLDQLETEGYGQFRDRFPAEAEAS